MTTEPATVLDDRYRLIDELGQGGMSDVFRAHDELLNRDVAVKMLRQVEDPALHARFIAEAQLLAGLDHPGLITLLDAGIRSDRPYLVMTLADGPTLGVQLSAGPLPADTVAEIGAQVAAALAYAHRQGVTHRDVKPSNILLAEDSRPLLADFGIARLAGDLEQHTRTGETIGSPAYLAPEQAAGEPITSAVDIYSLGLVLLEALTGERAYPGPPLEAAVQRLTTPPSLPMSLPRAWRDLLEAMTARRPEDRPNADEVTSQLATIAAGATPPPPEDTERTGAMAAPVVTAAAAERELDATRTLAIRPYDDPAPSAETAEPVGVVEPVAYDDPPPRRRRRTWVWVTLLVLVAAALVAFLVLRQPAPSSNDRTDVPAGVPEKYQTPLDDLHHAIEDAR